MVSPIIPSKEEILSNYSNHLASKGAGRIAYLNHAKDFIGYADGKYDRQTIDAFLDNLKKNRHYKDGYVHLIFTILRTLFKRSGLDWPYNRGEAPVVREKDINAPALDPRTVKRAIAAVRMCDNPAAKAILALSTTYGLRRGEIINLTSKDIRYKDKTIYIATLKHGRERTHILPDPIIPWLKPYDFDDKARTEWFMIQLWYNIEQMINLEHIPHLGWHSLRRSLDTILLESLTETTVSSFLRWKQATSTNMAFRYSRTQYYGEEESVTKLSGESLTIDQRIFEKDKEGNYIHHPFIQAWE